MKEKHEKTIDFDSLEKLFRTDFCLYNAACTLILTHHPMTKANDAAAISGKLALCFFSLNDKLGNHAFSTKKLVGEATYRIGIRGCRK